MIRSYFDEFAEGMLACEFYVYIQKAKEGRTCPSAWFMSGVCLATLAFYGADSVRYSLHLKNNNQEGSDALIFRTQPYVRVFLNIILTSGLMLLVTGAAFLKREVAKGSIMSMTSASPGLLDTSTKWLNKLCFWTLANPASQLLGIMCFSIYIWHSHIYERFFTVATPDDLRVLYFLVYLPVTFGFAAVSCTYIEFPKLSN